MAELLDAVTSWRSLVLVLAVFGFAPGFCLRLIVLIYPRGDLRRAELIAELYTIPRIERPFWVAEQLKVGLSEGLRHRVSAAVIRRRLRRAEKTAERGAAADPLKGKRIKLGDLLDNIEPDEAVYMSEGLLHRMPNVGDDGELPSGIKELEVTIRRVEVRPDSGDDTPGRPAR